MQESTSLFPSTKPLVSGDYRVRFLDGLAADLSEVQHLRYAVFQAEFHNQDSPEGIDADKFDPQFHHLVIEHVPTQRIIGTYRLQTASIARANLGFYAAEEYDLSSLPPEFIAEAGEIGRVCISPKHRNMRVIHLLWRGVGHYMVHHNVRYIIGCVSLFSQQETAAKKLLNYFQQHNFMSPTIYLATQSKYQCELDPTIDTADIEVPKLIKVYLSMFHAEICSGPAMDRDFKTIDFFSVCDLHRFNDRLRKVFLNGE